MANKRRAVTATAAAAAKTREQKPLEVHSVRGGGGGLYEGRSNKSPNG